jgi:hypothetical protein
MADKETTEGGKDKKVRKPRKARTFILVAKVQGKDHDIVVANAKTIKELRGYSPPADAPDDVRYQEAVLLGVPFTLSTVESVVRKPLK